ncbi:hypothetical protein [Leuconostoc citreum]|nr:hypothetical protein [Leuconostoc citreum]
MEVDAQEVINNLGLQLAQKSVEVATLTAQVKQLQEQLNSHEDKEG